MPPTISLITLAVEDIARARAFYQALGLEAVPPSNDSVVFLPAGGVVLGLYGRAALAADTGLAEARPGGITLAFNVPNPADVDARLAEAVAAGARVLAPPRDMPWGGRTAYFADPDGHPWEITWVRGIALTPDGQLVLDSPRSS